ncbi:glycerol-3-phosphate acyltransferase [Betaproteobacteria bacterium]|nr:glycerol-3-phosphate acyltransferase [Betaproteobacteria bacterium]GHU12914.1 glycerol-3-phosphate acyltransferase [Betaproteobacteria bacterium]GHU22647.1 glycerol-3-phosphate acyltransferase [Betaproteobacteria bacterium]
MSFVFILLLFLGAYVLGSIPFAIIASRLFRLKDPRSYGSSNPGATNVLRSGNKTAAALTLVGDCLKGWLAVWAAGELGFGPLTAALAGLAAFLGHVFSLFLRFKGGKGVATALGVLTGISLWLALAILGIWLLVALFSRYSSAAALAAAIAAPFVTGLISGNMALVLIVLLMSIMLIWRHSANLKRLFAGKEGRIGAKKSAAGK